MQVPSGPQLLGGGAGALGETRLLPSPAAGKQGRGAHLRLSEARPLAGRKKEVWKTKTASGGLLLCLPPPGEIARVWETLAGTQRLRVPSEEAVVPV